jgi:hypothetical protein
VFAITPSLAAQLQNFNKEGTFMKKLHYVSVRWPPLPLSLLLPSAELMA